MQPSKLKVLIYELWAYEVKYGISKITIAFFIKPKLEKYFGSKKKLKMYVIIFDF